MTTTEPPKLFIVIPAYNEAENIIGTVEAWYAILESLIDNGQINSHSALVVIDDGSDDQTPKLLEQLSTTRRHLIALFKSNEGHGPTLIFGYEYSIKNGADWIFQTDADGQTSPTEFSAFWGKKDAFDLLIGYRPQRGDGKARALVEKVVCLLVKIFFGANVPDANAPFRLMKGAVLSKYLYLLPRDFNLPNIVLTAFFASRQENLIFLPITFAKRTKGRNSINLGKIVRIGAKAILDFKKISNSSRSQEHNSRF